MPMIEIRGVDIHYQVEGEGEPVVFLNGILMTAQSWVLQTAVLRRRYRCVVHDFRGQLLSGKPEQPFTLETHARDLAGLLDHLGIGRCHLVGTSYGGEVGMLFALGFPDRTKSLAVISSTSRVGPRLERSVELWAETARERPEALYRTIAPWTFSSAFMAASPEVIEAGEARLRQAPAEFFPALARLVEAFKRLDITGELHRIACPTLVLCGEEDALKPPRHSRTIARSIPEAELLIVPDAGHALVLEKPEAVNTALIGFIEKHR